MNNKKWIKFTYSLKLSYFYVKLQKSFKKSWKNLNKSIDKRKIVVYNIDNKNKGGF